MDATLHALAEPTRREILELVQLGELPAGAIAERFDVTRSAISQHLRVLRGAGLVSERRDGTRRLYRARPEGLADLRTYLERFWGGRLAELKREVEHAKGEREMAQTETETLVLETRIEAKPDEIFPFLTDPAKMTCWMGRSATLDPRPGGVFLVDVTGEHVARGEYVTVEPPTRVVFTWGWDGKEDVAPGASTVEIELLPDGEATIVRLSHRGLPAEAMEPHRHGWSHYAQRLAIVAVGGDPGPDTMGQ